MFDRKVTFSREQVSELNPYEPCEVPLPENNYPFTLRVLVEKIADQYDLTTDMIYLRNGEPITMDTVLVDGDHVFGKQGMKSRGK